MDRVYDHLICEGILPPEQKGIKRRARGCKDHLLLNKFTLECTHTSKCNLSVLWINYQKAYDSVLHSWIKWVLRLYNIFPAIRNFIETLIPFWCTQLNLHHTRVTISTTDIAILCGIVQGNSLSPLIFCIALFLLSNILSWARTGFQIGKKKISHLLYIDNLKVYTKNEEELEMCEQLIKQFSANIGMPFGLDKCVVLTIELRKNKPTDILPDILRLDEDHDYRYLGVYKGADFLTDRMKKATSKEYLSRVCSILKAQLTANSTTMAICAYDVPVMRYTFGIIRWTKIELRQLDKKTRHILIANGCLHTKSSIKRLHLHRNKGDCSLTSVKALTPMSVWPLHSTSKK
eukprot:360497-Ditylum_brightwellii.AAC.2